MNVNRKINPERLKDLLDRCPRSQKQLAADIGVDVGTLSRWKKGKIRTLRSDKLARLCKALGTTASELCADGPLPEDVAVGDAARRDQVTLMLDTACRNALSLIARRYGVTRQQIVEVAPLLFAITAEHSLAQRRQRLEAYRGAALPHLSKSLRGPFDEDDQELLEAEQRSIEKRDLFAARVGGWDETHHKNNPFANFLKERLSEFIESLSKTDLAEVTWDEDEAPRYMIGVRELDDLLGSDKDAHQKILSGKVALAEMPGDIRQAARETRASWVKDKAELNDHELRAVVADPDDKILENIDFLNPKPEPAEGGEQEF